MYDRVLEPENVEPMEEAIDALEDADLIVHGSYTQVLFRIYVLKVCQKLFYVLKHLNYTYLML